MVGDDAQLCCGVCHKHARHLRACKITSIGADPSTVLDAAGDEQVVAFFGCLGGGSCGDLQIKTMVELGKDEAKGVTRAAGKHAGALVGRIPQLVNCFGDLLDCFGAHFFGMIENIRDGSQRNARFACDVSDSYIRHLISPIDAFQSLKMIVARRFRYKMIASLCGI